MPGMFQSPVKARRPVQLKPAMLRDFSGGWNAVDTDDLLATKFSITAQNMLIGTDGSVGVRPGTEFFANVAGVVTGSILNMIYFADHIIVVTTSGQIAAVDDAGVATAIWNTAIAAALVGAPPAWGITTYVSFVPFKRELIIHNGVNSPITISLSLAVTYLQDLASGSNINVPIGFYGCTVSNYHVVAGITKAPASSGVDAVGLPQPTVIYITSIGTGGTFPGDPAPNDALAIDIGAYASLGAVEIRGVAGYRNQLMVFFRESTLVITLGNYQSGVHVPLYNDTLTKFGLLNQRCILYLDNDILFGAIHGLASAKRNIFAGLIESKTLSEIIKPAYNEASRTLTDTQEKLNAFTVRDTAGNTIYHFMGSACIAYTFNETLRVRGWAGVSGWNWTSGCESKQGRVFFSLNSKIYRLGNTTFPGEEQHADFMNERDSVWSLGLAVTAGQEVFDPATDTTWTALVNLTTPGSGTMKQFIDAAPDNWDQYLGVPIDIDWELPWTDLRDPERVKTIRTLKIATKGAARFTFSLYVDGLYKDELGNVIHDPALSIELVGSEQQGFGGSPDQYYGGGRMSQDPRLYKFPVRFKRMKCRITGSLTKKLSISWIAFMHHRGGLHRP